MERLRADFYNKCYLCGEAKISSIEVDHLQPHGDDRDLKFDWNNLFYSCRHCNGTKGITWPVLDCTDPAVPVLSRLRYRYRALKLRAVVEVEATTEDVATRNTADLLNRIYNGRSNNRRLEAENILEKMQGQCRRFFATVGDYAAGKGTQEERSVWRDRISRDLSPTSSFSALRAWAVIRHGKLVEEFQNELVRLGFLGPELSP